LIEIGSKTAEKNCTNKQTNRQTDKPTDTTKIMVTWPWTNNYIYFTRGRGGKYCDELVCTQYVCLSCISQKPHKLQKTFCTCYPWPYFGPPLSTV